MNGVNGPAPALKAVFEGGRVLYLPRWPNSQALLQLISQSKPKRLLKFERRYRFIELNCALKALHNFISSKPAFMS